MTVSWGAPLEQVLNVALLSAALYISVFIAVRIAGRRTVSQMSAFDVVVTIAIGSLIATTLLSSDVSFTIGLTAIVTLLAVQQLVAMVRQRIPVLANVLDFQPELVFSDGKPQLRQHPFAAQLTEAELKTQLRQQGIGGFDSVDIVILEPNGQVSVWRSGDEHRRSAVLWDKNGD